MRRVEMDKLAEWTVMLLFAGLVLYLTPEYRRAAWAGEGWPLVKLGLTVLMVGLVVVALRAREARTRLRAHLAWLSVMLVQFVAALGFRVESLVLAALWAVLTWRLWSRAE